MKKEREEVIMDLVLNTGEIISIDGDARNLTVSCLSGALWMTQPEDPKDYIIRPGEKFVVSRKGLIAVTALESARVHLADPVELRQACLPWQVQAA